MKRPGARGSGRVALAIVLPALTLAGVVNAPVLAQDGAPTAQAIDLIGPERIFVFESLASDSTTTP